MKPACFNLFSRSFERLCDTLAFFGERIVLSADRRKAFLPDLRERAESIWDERVPGVREWLGALLMFGQGFWLALPFDTFGSTKAFHALARVSPECLWAAALCFLPLLRLDAVLLDDTNRRELATLLAVVLWATLGAMLLIGNPTSPGGAAYLGLALVEACTFRAGRLKEWEAN